MISVRNIAGLVSHSLQVDGHNLNSPWSAVKVSTDAIELSYRCQGLGMQWDKEELKLFQTICHLHIVNGCVRFFRVSGLTQVFTCIAAIILSRKLH